MDLKELLDRTGAEVVGGVVQLYERGVHLVLGNHKDGTVTLTPEGQAHLDMLNPPQVAAPVVAGLPDPGETQAAETQAPPDPVAETPPAEVPAAAATLEALLG